MQFRILWNETPLIKTSTHTHKSVCLSAEGRIRLTLVICPMQHPGILFSLHPRSRRGGQQTSQLRPIMVNPTCGAAVILADFDKEVREREWDRERMSAGLVESGELWHPQNGQVSLYLTACLHRFNITLAAILRFALHRVQFIHTNPKIQHPSYSAAMSRGWDKQLACGERLRLRVLAQILRDVVVRWVIPPSCRQRVYYCPVYKSNSEFLGSMCGLSLSEMP